MTLFQVSYSLLWALAIGLALMSVVLLYLLAQLQEQIGRESSGFGNKLIGRTMPKLAAKDYTGGMATEFCELTAREHTLLLLSPDCHTCRSLIADLKLKSKVDLTKLGLGVLCMGDFERSRAAVSGIDSVPVLIQDVMTDETVELWMAGHPAALIVNEVGIVIDVRHPLTINGLVAAVKSSKSKNVTVATNPSGGRAPPERRIAT